jgi:hypothetical protein
MYDWVRTSGIGRCKPCLQYCHTLSVA